MKSPTPAPSTIQDARNQPQAKTQTLRPSAFPQQTVRLLLLLELHDNLGMSIGKKLSIFIAAKISNKIA